MRGDSHEVRDRPRSVRHAREGVDVARDRFGGLDVPATLGGTLAALGSMLLLAGLAGGGAASLGYAPPAGAVELTAGALVAGLAVLLVSFLIGGWVAGRIARYEGVWNGVVSALWFLVLVGAATLAGERYGFFDRVRLPQWFSSSDTRSVGTAVAGIAIVLLAGGIGGALGSWYHRRADRLIADTGEGALLRSERDSAEISRSEDTHTHKS